MKAPNIMFAIASDNKYSADKKKINITYYSGPGVYLACLRKQVLYVGFGRDVIKRCKCPDVFNERRCAALTKCDRIEIYPCDSVAQAKHLEAELISIYQPEHNFLGRDLKTPMRAQITSVLVGTFRHRGKGLLPAAACTFAHLQAQHAKLFEGVA